MTVSYDPRPEWAREDLTGAYQCSLCLENVSITEQPEHMDQHLVFVPRVSLVKDERPIPPSGAEVEFIGAGDDTRTWLRGEYAFTSNTGMAYVRIPSKDSVVAHKVYICLPTDVRLYR